MLIVLLPITPLVAQDMPNMWDSRASEEEHHNIQWFRDAKFGIFIHWGLYSQLAGKWQDQRYYGSGEWLMFQGKIPYKAYAAEAQSFNPTAFDAQEWVSLAKEAGARYIVATSKHHEGFAMYDSQVSDFSITKASPYGQDPMKALADEAHRQSLPFGFYYSQFLDWHEPNGGGNDWDFKGKKDYLKYYHEKSIPQLKELMTKYGKLGMLWFDMPGGMDKVQTKALIDTLHRLQPDCLFSSRVGQGLGDYIDLGDSEMPPAPIARAWEAIYTFNDSWGYIDHDLNFKTPKEIIRLIAQASSKGGNLMLNIGPDGKGNIPPICIDFLKETGKWLKRNGESIYETTFGAVPAQPWGVTTSKPGKLYLHIFDRPRDNRILVPGFRPKAKHIRQLHSHALLKWEQRGTDIYIQLPDSSPQGLDAASEVYVIDYDGPIPPYVTNQAITISDQYVTNDIPVAQARLSGNAKVSNLTFSHYFGDWKHVTCLQGLSDPQDQATFQLRVMEPGYYKLSLEYANAKSNGQQEGLVQLDHQTYHFRTLPTIASYGGEDLIPFIKHDVAIVHIPKAGPYTLSLQATSAGKELFKLKQLHLTPVNH